MTIQVVQLLGGVMIADVKHGKTKQLIHITFLPLGGQILGKAADSPNHAAKTLYCVMVKCCFSNKTFLVRLVPVFSLDAKFSYKIIEDCIRQLERCGATVISLINDNLRTNQAAFKMFKPMDPSEPWKVHCPAGDHPMFLLYDPIHIFKNIRNNWHSGKDFFLRIIDIYITISLKWIAETDIRPELSF